MNFYKQQSNGWRFKFTHPPPEYSESLKLPYCMLGLPIGFTWGLNHTSKGTVTFPLLAPHGEYPQNSPWGHIRAVSVRCPCEWLGTGAFYPSALWAGGVLSSRSGRAGARLPELVARYLWNRLTDFLRSKFCGIVLPCSCALLWSYAHLPHMGLPIGQKLVKFATNWVQTLWHAYLWNCWMDLAHLKFRGLVDTCSCTTA